jgi:hypothetical protein
MKRAAVYLLALCTLSALCAPTVLQAQEDAFTARAAALAGFGEAFRNSACLRDSHDARPLRIAVAEMATSPKFTDSAARTITDRVEAALARDPSLEVVPLRLRGELAEIRKALAGQGLAASGGSLDGFLAIRPDADREGRPAVNVAAYAAGTDCVGPARTVAAGEIRDAPDAPEAFFRHAARELDDGQIERLVVMEPVMEPEGLGIERRGTRRSFVAQFRF